MSVFFFYSFDVLDSSRLNLFSAFYVASEDDLLGASGTSVLPTFFVLAKSRVKGHSLVVASTSCLMNPAPGRINNELETNLFTTAFINGSDWDHLLKVCLMTSLTAARLNQLITIDSENWADVVLVLSNAALLTSYNMLARVFLIWVCMSA